MKVIICASAYACLAYCSLLGIFQQLRVFFDDQTGLGLGL